MRFFSSLSIKLTAAFIIFVLIPIYMAMLLFYQAYNSTLESKVQDYSNKSFEQMYQIVGGRLLDLVRVSNLIVFNPQIKQMMERIHTEQDWQFYLDLDIADRIFAEMQDTGRVAPIYFTLVSQDGSVFGNWSSLPGKDELHSDWYKKAMERSPFPTWLPLQTSYLKASSSSNPSPSKMISMVRAMDSDTGVLRTSIEQSQIDHWLSEIHNNWKTLIYNHAGELMYGHDDALPSELKLDLQHRFTNWNSIDVNQFNKGGYRVISQGLPLKGWTVVQLLDEADLYKDIHFLMKGFIVFSFLILLIFIGITLLITNRIIDPLKKLKWAMKRVGEGKWTEQVQVKVTTNDEISQIALHFNQMVQQIHDLFEQLREEERKKSAIYYESLLAQINPHFLFNTLSSIKWTATISKAHHVADLLSSLGTILEMSTSRVEDRIRLSQELEYVKHYMNLQYARFGERVHVSIDIPKQLEAAMLPKFLIQPLVENAIIHGFEQHEIRGDIRIEAVQQNNELLIFVKDNGKGISLDKLEALFGMLEPAEGKRISGIGVHNVQERLRIMYGRRYGMIFCSEEGAGTVVRIVLPLTIGTEGSLYVQGAYRG